MRNRIVAGLSALDFTQIAARRDGAWVVLAALAVVLLVGLSPSASPEATTSNLC
jgi:hypothetical protein